MGRPLETKRAAETRLPAKPATVTIDGIEVTQAVQNLAHGVPLIAGKATLVRVYLTMKLNFPTPLGLPSASAMAELSARRAPGGPLTRLVASNSINVPVQLSLKERRKDLALSVNFLVPAKLLTPGDLYLRVLRIKASIEGIPFALPIPVPTHATRKVTLIASPPLRVRILGMRYASGSPAQNFEPAERDFQMVLSWLRRAYPVAEVLSTHTTIDATSTWPFACGDVNAQLSAIRGLDVASGTDRRTHYYGLVSDGVGFMRGCASGIPQTPDPATVASGPTGSSGFAWDTDGCYGDWYTGHEFGHTFGRFHPGFCGETHDDSSYPFPNGQLSDSNEEFVGLDFGDAALGLPMRALPGVDWHDVMTYCDFQWLSSYTYMGVRNRIVAEASLGPTPGATKSAVRSRKRASAGNLIHAVARVNIRDRAGKFVFVHPIPIGDVSPEDRESPVLLSALDANRKVLAQYKIAPKYDTCQEGGPGGGATVDAVIPQPAGLRALRLVVGGEIVDTFEPSRVRPAPRALKAIVPKGAAAATIAWDEASAAKDLTYAVQTSVDGGQTWQTQAIGLKTRKFKLDREELGKAEAVKVRVIASNGFQSAVTTLKL
jgi:hypothetical protein